MSKNLFRKKQPNTIHYEKPTAIRVISDSLISHIPRNNKNIIAMCIGTDRSTGDSLGPLTGTLLSKMKPKYIELYGTLHDPVHALNLEEHLISINNKYINPFIIAVDASLGRSSSIGNLINGKGSLKPGAALKKDLPAVGNIHLTGVVNIAGYMDFSILQSTRLSIVHDMAEKLALSLKTTDNWLHYKQATARKSNKTSIFH